VTAPRARRLYLIALRPSPRAHANAGKVVECNGFNQDPRAFLHNAATRTPARDPARRSALCQTTPRSFVVIMRPA